MKNLTHYLRPTARVATTGFNFMQWLYKIIFVTLVFTSQAFAEEKEFLVKIKDHKFEPASINVPANEKFKLVIENLDKTLEEFESVDLKKEKLVGGGKKITIVIAPLKSGEYKFFGDFHQKTAQGKIVVQ